MDIRVNPGDIERQLKEELDKWPKVYGSAAVDVYATRRFNQILLGAEDKAKKYQDEYVSVEHIFMVLISERNTFTSKLLKRYGITIDAFIEAVKN